MSYDPFSRGPFPVGVRSTTLQDTERDRSIPLELWYPASPRHQGQDLDPATRDHFKLLAFAPETSQDAVRDASAVPGTYPVVLFSHGWSGHRRQTTHLCTHLSSHGYLVGSIDHLGNTVTDLIQFLLAARSGKPIPDGNELASRSIDDRPQDLSFALDAFLKGDVLPKSVTANPDQLGVSGHSFGGWTALMVAARDTRIHATLPLAPAGGASPIAEDQNLLRDTLNLDWGRSVPTLYLAAEHDVLCPLDGVRELCARTPAPSRLIALGSADHMHFSDRAEEAHELFRNMGSMISGGMSGGPDIVSVLEHMKPIDDLVSGDIACHFTRSLGLAHMDAHLRKDTRANEFFNKDLERVFSEREIQIRVD